MCGLIAILDTQCTGSGHLAGPQPTILPCCPIASPKLSACVDTCSLTEKVFRSDRQVNPHSYAMEDSQAQLILLCSKEVNRKESVRLEPGPRSLALCNSLTSLSGPGPGLVPAIPGAAFTGFSLLPFSLSPQATVNLMLEQSSPPCVHQGSWLSCHNLSWLARCPGERFPWRSFQIGGQERCCRMNFRLRQT